MKDNLNANPFESIRFPIVKNVTARIIGQDLKPYDPNNPQDVKEMGDVFKSIYEKIKADFDAKGIPMSGIVIDHTPGPITYAVKTVDKDGNVLHSQP